MQRDPAGNKSDRSDKSDLSDNLLFRLAFPGYAVMLHMGKS